MYDIIRTIYMNTAADGSEASRVSVLQQTLSQLRLTNIATLDACMNHFTRLIDLTSAGEDYVAALATSLAPCILRPRAETSLTLEERHAYKLVRDLFAHKEAVFSELKRMSTLAHSTSVGSSSGAGGGGGSGSNRPRAVSTDESNRKALVEERNRALLEKANASRSRATSPAPSPRGHRRDRSTGGPETRFPIQTSPTSAADRHRSSLGSLNALKRTSLEPPSSDGAAAGAPPLVEGGGGGGVVNGGPETPKAKYDADVTAAHDKKGGGTRFVGGRRVPSSPPDDSAPRGVTLEDKAMDD